MNYRQRKSPVPATVPATKRKRYLVILFLLLVSGIICFVMLSEPNTNNTSDPINLTAYTSTAFEPVTSNDPELWRKDCGSVNPLLTWANNEKQMAYFSPDTNTMHFIDLATGNTLKSITLSQDIIPNPTVNFFPIRFIQDHLYYKSISEPFIRIAHDGTVQQIKGFEAARSATVKDGAVITASPDVTAKTPALEAAIKSITETHGDIKHVAIFGDIALIIHYVNKRSLDGIIITFEHQFDIVTAIQIHSGETIWRHRYDFATWLGIGHGKPIIGLRTNSGHGVLVSLNLQNGLAHWGIKTDSFTSDCLHLTPSHLLMMSPQGSASIIDYDSGNILRKVRVHMEMASGYAQSFLSTNDRIMLCSTAYKGSDIAYILHCFELRAVGK